MFSRKDMVLFQWWLLIVHFRLLRHSVGQLFSASALLYLILQQLPLNMLYVLIC